jgi:hypothetical protein
VRYGCLKITKCREDNIRVGKHGSTCDNGDTWDNDTWDNFKLIPKGPNVHMTDKTSFGQCHLISFYF